jgi:SAM-dependent methyltransferase
MRHKRLAFWLLTALLAASLAGASQSLKNQGWWPNQDSLAPYVPTPQDVVERMLELAEVTSRDFLYDLGCGDGRIVITAAKKYGARGVGIDIDPQRVKEAQANAREAGVESLTTFRIQDARTVDVSSATVVTLYLLPNSNTLLRPLITKQLKPGARIVSHAFDMDEWEPVEMQRFKDLKGDIRTLYLWIADGKVRPDGP